MLFRSISKLEKYDAKIKIFYFGFEHIEYMKEYLIKNGAKIISEDLTKDPFSKNEACTRFTFKYDL